MNIELINIFDVLSLGAIHILIFLQLVFLYFGWSPNQQLINTFRKLFYNRKLYRSIDAKFSLYSSQQNGKLIEKEASDLFKWFLSIVLLGLIYSFGSLAKFTAEAKFLSGKDGHYSFLSSSTYNIPNIRLVSFVEACLGNSSINDYLEENSNRENIIKLLKCTASPAIDIANFPKHLMSFARFRSKPFKGNDLKYCHDVAVAADDLYNKIANTNSNVISTINANNDKLDYIKTIISLLAFNILLMSMIVGYLLLIRINPRIAKFIDKIIITTSCFWGNNNNLRSPGLNKTLKDYNGTNNNDIDYWEYLFDFHYACISIKRMLAFITISILLLIIFTGSWMGQELRNGRKIFSNVKYEDILNITQIKRSNLEEILKRLEIKP